LKDKLGLKSKHLEIVRKVSHFVVYLGLSGFLLSFLINHIKPA